MTLRPDAHRPARPAAPVAARGAGAAVTRDPGPWPRRLALATVACSVPLFAFGGSVTTMGAGLAVEGWWNAEGHFLPFFPVEKWFRDPATFVEHTHRLFGMLVGLCAVLLVAVTWRRDRRRSARTLAVCSLAAICAQGALGGFRVLERSPELAFLHGAFAQATFALLVATAVVLSPSWRTIRFKLVERFERASTSPPRGRRLRLVAAIAAAVVFAQVVAGAWYRHGLRPAHADDVAMRFGLHALLAVAVLFAVTVLGQALRAAASSVRARGAEPAAQALTVVASRLQLLLGVQILLGLSAWAAHRPEALTFAEGALAVLHVLGGAALLAQTVVATLWAYRVERPVASDRPVLDGLGSELGGAR